MNFPFLIALCAATGAVVGSMQPRDAAADETTVQMRHLAADGLGGPAGTIRFTDNSLLGGITINPTLYQLPPGPHGFHIHANPSCAPATKNGDRVPGAAAGGHFDPHDTGRHAGPFGDGHLGDLPVLWVGPSGDAQTPMFAPRLSVDRLRGHAVIIHAQGDNYKDTPDPLGGGGTRIACGVVK